MHLNVLSGDKVLEKSQAELEPIIYPAFQNESGFIFLKTSLYSKNG